MRARTALITSIVGALVFTSALAARQEPLSKSDREIAVQMLKWVRDDLQNEYFDPKCRGIDVAAWMTQAEATIRASTSANEVSRVLTDFLDQLKDSHTFFIPPGRSTRAQYGWRMSIVGDAPYVVEVEPGSDAAAKGLEVGDRVISLNRDRPDRTNLWRLRYYYRAIRPQAQQHVVVKKPSGEERAYDILSKVTQVSILQPQDMLDEFEAALARVQQPDQFGTVGKDIFVWQLKRFSDPGRIQDGTRKARGYATVILDMRGNPGGRLNALSALVSQTFDHPVTIMSEQRRNKVETEIAKPAKGAFTGRIIALVDSESASAAEIYARILQIEKRGSIIGDRSAGAVMMSRVFPHTIGMGRYLTFASSITIADLRMSDGSSLEAIGVTPDELVLPAGADLAAESDPVLSRAVERAGGTLTPAAAGKIFAGSAAKQ